MFGEKKGMEVIFSFSQMFIASVSCDSTAIPLFLEQFVFYCLLLSYCWKLCDLALLYV